MKKTMTAIIIIIAVILLVIASNLYLIHVTNELAVTLTQSEKYARSGNITKAKANVRSFLASWDIDKHILGTFIRHAEIDIANQSASKLLSYLDYKDGRSNFMAECDTLIMQLHHIADTEKFTVDNVL